MSHLTNLEKQRLEHALGREEDTFLISLIGLLQSFSEMRWEST